MERDKICVFKHIMQSCLPLLCNCVTLVYDDTTKMLIQYVEEAARELNIDIQTTYLNTGSAHGEEPPNRVLNEMFNGNAVMCMTRYSLAHTRARKQLEEKGIPFLSMPDYDLKMLENKALMVDYQAAYPYVKMYSDMLSECKRIRIESKKGTSFFIDVEGRYGNCCPGWTDEVHLLGSPPDIEANIAPIEELSNGTLVIDASITDRRVGLLDSPVILDIQNGHISKIECKNSNTGRIIQQIFREADSDKAYIVGEFGIGFNEQATICGNMLIDEGVKGCVHFGLGSNWTIGGVNKIDFHLDFVMKDSTVYFDDNCVIKNGRMKYE